MKEKILKVFIKIAKKIAKYIFSAGIINFLVFLYGLIQALQSWLSLFIRAMEL